MTIQVARTIALSSVVQILRCPLKIRIPRNGRHRFLERLSDGANHAPRPKPVVAPVTQKLSPRPASGCSSNAPTTPRGARALDPSFTPRSYGSRRINEPGPNIPAVFSPPVPQRSDDSRKCGAFFSDADAVTLLRIWG